MANLADFERDKKEIKSIIDSLSKVCDLDTDTNVEPKIRFKLFELHKKVTQTNNTLENILKEMSNIERTPLTKLQKSLHELIVNLETSVCVPEFCINSDIHDSCQFLTKKLIDHLQEVSFCYNLTEIPRASNKGIRKKEIDKSLSMYKSVAPNSNLIRDSIMKKQSIKCKRRKLRAKESEPDRKIGRFSITTYSEAPSLTVGKKRKLKSKTKPKKQKKETLSPRLKIKRKLSKKKYPKKNSSK